MLANWIEDEGVRTLAVSGRLDHLARLDLTATGVSPEGIKALADSNSLNNLVSLRLAQNELLGDEGVKALLQPGQPALASLAYLGRLKKLDLRDTRLTHEGAAALARSPYL